MNSLDLPHVSRPPRTQWLDYDKGITIILVGYGHALSNLVDTVSDLNRYPLFTYLGSFLYGFRMPLFFIISGVLVGTNLQKKGLLKYLMTRADLLHVMLVWGVIEISLKIMIHSTTVSYWSYLYLLIDPRQTGHFWYLNALVCIGILYALTKTKLKLRPIQQLGTGLTLFVIASYALFCNLRAGFVIDIGRYYIFFALGDALSQWLRDEKRQQALATWRVFLPLLFLFLALQYYCTQINMQHSEYGYCFVEQKMPALYFLQVLVGCATSMVLSFLLQKHGLFRWLTVIGFYSLYIFLMQMIVISIARILLQNVCHLETPVLIISLWLIGTLLPIVLYKTLLSFGFWWLFSFSKPGKKLKVRVMQTPVRFKTRDTKSIRQNQNY